GPALVEVGLYVVSRQRQARRAAVHHATDGGAMTLAPGRDPKQGAEGIVGHGLASVLGASRTHSPGRRVRANGGPISTVGISQFMATREPGRSGGTMVDAANDARFWDRAARKYAAGRIADMPGYERTLERTRHYLKRSDKVLELGCGTGT